jgi:Flp pilus assembly pilin Flp
MNLLMAWASNKLATREEGQGMAEYTMIIGAISIVLIGLFIATDLTSAVTAQVTALAAKIDPAP